MTTKTKIFIGIGIVAVGTLAYFAFKKDGWLNAGGPTQAGATKDHKQVFCRCNDGANVVDCTDYRTVGDAANCVKCCRNHGGAKENPLFTKNAFLRK